MSDLTDKRLARDLRTLIPRKGVRNVLQAAPAPKPIAATLGRAYPEIDSPAPSGGGLVSPLTETGRQVATVRVYDPADSANYIDVEQITQLTMEDAEGTEIVFNFAAP